MKTLNFVVISLVIGMSGCTSKEETALVPPTQEQTKEQVNSQKKLFTYEKQEMPAPRKSSKNHF